MSKKIFTRGADGERLYEYCVCCVCEGIDLCTVVFDFYTISSWKGTDKEDQLVCEACFQKMLPELMADIDEEKEES
jgi:hypothetical protein